MSAREGVKWILYYDMAGLPFKATLLNPLQVSDCKQDQVDFFQVQSKRTDISTAYKSRTLNFQQKHDVDFETLIQCREKIMLKNWRQHSCCRL
jgi:hypothetical protein